MLSQRILLDFGGVYFSLRALLLLLAFAAYACVCLVLAPRRAVRREKAAWALLCGFVGMLLLGRAGYLLLDKNATPHLLSGGEVSFFGFIGFFAGVRLYCFKSPKAFRKLTGLFAAPFFALAAVMYLLRDGTAGIPAARGGLFRYTDLYGLSRWNAPLLQGTLVLLLLAAAYAAKYLTENLQKKMSEKTGKMSLFRIKLLPMTLAALSLILPAELLRDTTQYRLFGVPGEALAMWFCLIALLAVYLRRRLADVALPLRNKMINAALTLVLPLCAMFTLDGKNMLLCLVFTALPVFLTLSPLYPFVKRPSRPPVHRRRRFS